MIIKEATYFQIIELQVIKKCKVYNNIEKHLIEENVY